LTTYSQLRRLFTDLSLAALATHAMGCVDDSISRSGFTEISCAPAILLAEAAFRSEADYLAIRRIALLSDLSVDASQAPMSEGATGVPCAGAPDQTACQAALAALPLTPGFGNTGWADTPFSHRQLVWTRGAETGVISSEAELLEFLGTLETPEQAALFANFTGAQLTCIGPNARPVEDGFHLITSTGAACGVGTSRSEHLVLVTPSGEITVERSEVVERGDSNCVIGRLTDGVAGPQRTPTRTSDRTSPRWPASRPPRCWPSSG
jgi:hypothetical protein